MSSKNHSVVIDDIVKQQEGLRIRHIVLGKVTRIAYAHLQLVTHHLLDEITMPNLQIHDTFS